jgi:hypothetical protein
MKEEMIIAEITALITSYKAATITFRQLMVQVAKICLDAY